MINHFGRTLTFIMEFCSMGKLALVTACLFIEIALGAFLHRSLWGSAFCSVGKEKNLKNVFY